MVSRNQNNQCVRQLYKNLLIEHYNILHPGHFLFEKNNGPYTESKIADKMSEIIQHYKIGHIIDKIKNIKHKAMIALLYSGRLGRSEAKEMLIKDVDFDWCLLKIRSGKGKKDRIVGLSKYTIHIVKEYLQ